MQMQNTIYGIIGPLENTRGGGEIIKLFKFQKYRYHFYPNTEEAVAIFNILNICLFTFN